LNRPAVASPGSVSPPGDFYNVDETIPYHDSSFDDLLTTSCSSENYLSEHTTPQEQIWEQQFISQDPSQPHILDQNVISMYDPGLAMSTNSTVPINFEVPGDTGVSKFNSGSGFLDSSMASSVGQSLHLPANSHGDIPSSDQTADQASTQLDWNKRRVSHTLRVDTTPNHTPSPNQKVGAWQVKSPSMRALSPVVMVSSYEPTDADSPPHEHSRQASNKRVHGSGSSDSSDDESADSDGEDEAGVSSSHLMPPDATETDHIRSGSPTRVGLEPQQRGEDVVPSIKDLDEQREREERNAEVQTWLATSDAGSEPGDGSGVASSGRSRSASKHRPHAAAGQPDALGRVPSDKHIPGPGVLVEDESDDEYFEEDPELTKEVVDEYHESGSPRMSPHALSGRDSPEPVSFPPLQEDTPPELQEPLPRQFYRRTPWQDPVRGPVSEARDQPNTSSAAAYKFNQEAAKWETASRAATWGTRRRLSDSEVSSIVENSQVRHPSLSKRGRERGSSFFNKARGKLLPRRSSSNIKQESSAEDEQTAPKGHTHRSSVGTIKPAQRMPSFSKPKSPAFDTGSALMAMSGQLAAVGRGNTMAQETELPKPSGFLQSSKKPRSKSDVSKPAQTPQPGLAQLITREVGPPVPTFASPTHERDPMLAAQVTDNEDAAADDDDDDQADEDAIKMDLEIRPADITPTVEGFKDHARQLNPRLDAYLLDRIGQEQVRRYKRLVEAKIKHTRSVHLQRKCPSEQYCFELGGEATLLAPRVSAKDAEATLTQFQVCKPGDNDIDESGFTEGVVTPALFPRGIPLPPVKRLPAEFECHLCFKVKKFQKPSDWTKHVHEDVQPFTCTFPHCPESKSFKRKADWVRHENERHRHLEWWKCNVPECSHVCYRKDNFVQHLVREHKMTEPKVKGRGSGSSKNKAVNPMAWQAGQEENAVWPMVNSCRTETLRLARDEPCRFCGNVCSTFKKLSVHMGKHMEQIAMPILALVELRPVSPNTIISPIEQPQPFPSSFTNMPAGLNHVESNNLSPYPTSATSAYQTSSAGQSPVSMQGRSHNGIYPYEGNHYSPHTLTPTMQAAGTHGAYGSYGSFASQTQAGMGLSNYVQPGDGRQAHQPSLSPQDTVLMLHPQPLRYGNPMFGPADVDYTQISMQSVYASAAPMQGYMHQYASPLADRSAHSSRGAGSPAGLGLPTLSQPLYGYGGAPDGEGGPANMQFP
jgi:hypothetical protein